MTPLTERSQRRWVVFAMIAVGVPLILAIGFPWATVNVYYYLRYREAIEAIARFSDALASGDPVAAAMTSSEEGGLGGRLKNLAPDKKERIGKVFRALREERLYVRGIEDFSPDELLVVVHYPGKGAPDGSSHIDFVLGRLDHSRIHSVSFTRVPGWDDGVL